MEGTQRHLYVIENHKNTARQLEILDDIGNTERKADHDKVINNYFVSKQLRNHSSTSIRNTQYILKRFFEIVGKPCWEVTIEDVNEYHLSLIEFGLANSSRRNYMNVVKTFYDFLLAHPEIPQTLKERQSGTPAQRVDWKYRVKLVHPVDLWFVPKHVTDDIAIKSAIPSRENMRAFFRLLRENTEDSSKPMILHRDYAMFRLMYHTGVRLDECRMLDLVDISFERGTIHIRYGKGAKGSGKRERWVPASLFGLDKVLAIYLEKVRPKFQNASIETALFLSEQGKRVSKATIKARLIEAIQFTQDKGGDIPFFTCHDFRRAFATHLYEDHPTKIEAIRHMLGHSLLGTTQKYLRPSSRFLEEQLRDVTNGRLQRLMGDGEPDD